MRVMVLVRENQPPEPRWEVSLAGPIPCRAVSRESLFDAADKLRDSVVAYLKREAAFLATAAPGLYDIREMGF